MAGKQSIRVGVLAAVAAMGLGLSGGVATAAPKPAHDGFVGACNMVAAGSGMDLAMSVNNANGNAGMNHAVDLTLGGLPYSC